MSLDLASRVRASEGRAESAMAAAAAGAPAVSSSLERKVDSVSDRVFQVIRDHMPVTTLFNPDLKIDLELFVRDQKLLYEIADFMVPLVGRDELDSEAIARHLESSELLARIRGMFAADATAYLALFYEACAQALKGSLHPRSSLQVAIEGRVFTLKNALIAQVNPEAVRQAQAKQKVPQQTLSSIQQEGGSFIRESLALYLEILRSPSPSSFREGLTATVQKLLPFVRQVTRKYLQENGFSCPVDPLVFRDRTGYNRHGLVAATVLEACLNALGYKTRLMGRSDLDPKVTMATAHQVVMVLDSQSSRYLVDPCYLQFHQDISVDETTVSKDPVLVLQSGEIEPYIETCVMPLWRDLFRRVRADDRAIIERLKAQDKLVSFTIDQSGLPSDLMPSDIEAWVKRAFQRVFGLSTYKPVLADAGFQEIFHGGGRYRGVYEWIKPMQMAALIDHGSYKSIEGQLQTLADDPTLDGQNSARALSLIAQLPREARLNYAKLLDCDPRLQKDPGMDVSLNAYFRALRRVVNPENLDLRVIYACSGADCSTPLLATNAQEFIFVDFTKVASADFEKALAWLKSDDMHLKMEIIQRLSRESYFGYRSRYAGSTSIYHQGRHYMNELALKALFDLQDLGVNLQDVKITSLEGGGVQLEFPWKYHGQAHARARRILFVSADIRNFESYPLLLKRKLQEGFDLFYMKAAFSVPASYPAFLPHLARCLRPKGWLMSADKTFTMEAFSPDPCLQAHQLTFTTYRNEEVCRLEELMEPPFDPLVTVPSLEMYSRADQRAARPSGSDLTYWAMLTLRQKTE